MQLNNFFVIEPSITPGEMKTICNKGFPFRTTMYSITEDVNKLLLDEAKRRKKK